MKASSSTADRRPRRDESPSAAPRISGLDVAAYALPTDHPESDGTVTWDETTLILVDVHAGSASGLGYTYGDRATAAVIDGSLRQAVIAAGEYGYDLVYFRRMLEAGAVDVLQADATRCGGFTGFLQVGALCEAFGVPLSAHTAPSLHLAPCCAVGRVRHVEYFHDHARIEQMLFEGAPIPRDGRLYPDLSRPGLGMEFKRRDAERFRVV